MLVKRKKAPGVFQLFRRDIYRVRLRLLCNKGKMGKWEEGKIGKHIRASLPVVRLV
jgi:hypothetical protein